MQPDRPAKDTVPQPAEAPAAVTQTGGSARPAGPLLPARRSARGQFDLRRSRARELARLLPLLGVVLFFLPLLGTNDRSTGPAGLWLFACWAGLIVVAALLAPGLKRDLEPGSGSPGEAP